MTTRWWTTQRVGAICLLTVGVVFAYSANAFGAASDPIYIFKPQKPSNQKEEAKEPPPTGYLEGPCGVAVNPLTHDIYISDYYHGTIDDFADQPTEKKNKEKEPVTYSSQISGEDPLDGPCGLATSETGALYVNNFHRNVANLTGHGILALPSEDPVHHLPTGVAIEPVTNRVYVDNRTYITVFESDGAQVMEGLEPLRIGVDAKASYYGLAVSATGRLYVADATTNKVKVFEPAIDKTNPVATINGPGKGFNSLRDASLAIDKASGVVYVTDNLQPTYTEEPEAGVYVYSASNALLGVLKYKVYDSLPVGITVDNGGGTKQGYVYVTSGNTDQAAVYAYGPGAQTSSFLGPSAGAKVKITGSGRGSVSSNTGEVECSSSCSAQPFDGSEITLDATPDPGSTFDGWSGDCSGSAPSCTITVGGAITVGADFNTSSRGESDSPGEGIGSGSGGTAVTLDGQATVRKQTARRRHHRRHHFHRRHRAKRH
jgi:List-Bact-rpt repeat protein